MRKINTINQHGFVTGSQACALISMNALMAVRRAVFLRSFCKREDGFVPHYVSTIFDGAVCKGIDDKVIASQIEDEYGNQFPILAQLSTTDRVAREMQRRMGLVLDKAEIPEARTINITKAEYLAVAAREKDLDSSLQTYQLQIPRKQFDQCANQDKIEVTVYCNDDAQVSFNGVEKQYDGHGRLISTQYTATFDDVFDINLAEDGQQILINQNKTTNWLGRKSHNGHVVSASRVGDKIIYFDSAYTKLGSGACFIFDSLDEFKAAMRSKRFMGARGNLLTGKVSYTADVYAVKSADDIVLDNIKALTSWQLSKKDQIQQKLAWDKGFAEAKAREAKQSLKNLLKTEYKGQRLSRSRKQVLYRLLYRDCAESVLQRYQVLKGQRPEVDEPTELDLLRFRNSIRRNAQPYEYSINRDTLKNRYASSWFSRVIMYIVLFMRKMFCTSRFRDCDKESLGFARGAYSLEIEDEFDPRIQLGKPLDFDLFSRLSWKSKSTPSLFDRDEVEDSLEEPTFTRSASIPT